MDQQDLVWKEVHPAGRELPAGIRVREVDGDLLDLIRGRIVESSIRQSLPQVARFLKELDRKGLQPPAGRHLKDYVGLVEPRRLSDP